MLQNHGYDFGQALPALGFGLELSASLCRQPIKLCLAAGFGGTPLGDEKLLVFQAVKSGIQGALLDLQCFLREHLHVLRNGISVNRPERDDTKNEEVQSALREIEFRWVQHAYDFYIYTITCRSARYHFEKKSRKLGQCLRIAGLAVAIAAGVLVLAQIFGDKCEFIERRLQIFDDLSGDHVSLLLSQR
jgi:hypothetical protein